MQLPSSLLWLILAGTGASVTLGRAHVRVPPSAMVAVRPTDAPASLTTAGPGQGSDLAHAADDGLFYVTARVNGHPVRFLVDTGASVVMLTRADAAAVGLNLGREAFRSHARTANGTSDIAWTTLDDVAIAGRQLSGLDAAVPREGLPVSLLGHNLLGKLGVVTIDGDRMQVRDRDAETDPS